MSISSGAVGRSGWLWGVSVTATAQADPEAAEVESTGGHHGHSDVARGRELTGARSFTAGSWPG